MRKNRFGEHIYSEDELMSALMVDSSIDISHTTTNAVLPNRIREVLDSVPVLKQPTAETMSVAEYDAQQQANWLMPDRYKTLDIAALALSLCKTDAELQRVGEELLLYQERDLFDLLRYLKYLVDTMRAKNIIHGVGRGSSVASYVLYLLGVHSINSLYYQLGIDEFLR